MYYIEEIIICASWIILCAYNIFVQLKNGEVRERGINTIKGMFKWEDIESYELSENDVLQLFTNKKTILTKKYKKIKFEINEEQAEKIKETLDKFIS